MYQTSVTQSDSPLKMVWEALMAHMRLVHAKVNRLERF